MAFRQVIAAIAAASFFFLTPARADECVSIDKFHYTLLSEGVTSYGSRAAATVKLEALLNENRTRNGSPAIKASIFLVGYVKEKDGKITAIVAVVGVNGCIIQDTLVTLPVDTWIKFLIDAGVDAREFVPIDGA